MNDNSEAIQIHANDQVLLKTGDSITITWRPNDLTQDLQDILQDDSDTNVQISLVRNFQ